MRIYLIDELQIEQVKKIKSVLKQENLQSPIEDIFHFPLPEQLLDTEQQEHVKTCAPYYLSLETGKTWIQTELLVRATSTLHCSCIKYANQVQREYIINRLDSLFKRLDIQV